MKYEQMILSAPHSPGIYKMYDSSGHLLYVGKAKDLVKRLKQYVDVQKLEYHKVLMMPQVRKVIWQITASESDALVLEQHLIKTEKPKYNIILKDDKMYPFLGFSDDKFPRVYKFREKGKNAQTSGTSKSNVFGPFPFVSDLDATIKLIQKSCKIRTCTNTFFAAHKNNPCILYQMGLCSAPCVQKYDSKEQLSNYKYRVKLAKSILSGKTKRVISDLTKHMKQASNEKNFELASRIKGQIQSLQETAGIGKVSDDRR